MFHPVYFQKAPNFHPIGDSAAVCLTQDLAPEENARVLLLASGDPRDILFTVYSSGADTAAVPRTIDFTCCEAEPAILARNVLLFTLVADNEASDTIWSIFFHFYLDQTSHALLISQCRKLIRSSESLDTWRNSQYASFLRISSSHTLSALRQQWTLYSKTGQGKKLSDKFATRSIPKEHPEELGLSYSASPSSGPLAMNSVKIFSGQFKHYWETGICSSDPEELAAATLANPTFAYSISGGGFAVHAETNPLLPFHLASALAPIKAGSRSQKGATNIRQVVDAVKVQFREGCRSFREALQTPGKIVVRVFLGDPLTLCHALLYCSINKSPTSGTYTSQWSATPLELDGGDYAQGAQSPAPVMFNVIETSNLVDRHSPLVVLMATTPLLARASSSSLYTHTSLSSRGDTITGFIDRLIIDLPMTSLLLGVTPSSYISNFTSRSNSHETVAHHLSMETPAPFRERITWKITSLGDPVANKHDIDVNRPASFDPQQIAKFLFGVYLKMFGTEDSPAGELFLLQDLLTRSIIHYLPSTFAALLRIVKDRIETEWDDAMTALFVLIEEDTTLPTGMRHYEDLCCQLHLLGVHSTDSLSPNQTIMAQDKVDGPFRDWEDIPPLVCVVVVVPRRNTKSLDDLEVQKAGAMIQCELRITTKHGTTMVHVFPSIQAVLGTVSTTGSNSNTRLVVKEDPPGWSGTAPVVVSFWVPSWLLVVEPSATSINLAVRSTPANNMLLLPKLGKDMKLFTTKLTEGHVYLVRELPNLSGMLDRIDAVSFNVGFTPNTVSNDKHIAVALDSSYQTVSTLAVRVDIVDDREKKVWGGGAIPTVLQISACAMKLSFGRFNKLLAFPFPVDGAGKKIRIARKSMYVEVVAPIAGPPIADTFFNPFPVIPGGKKPTVWNIHHLNLDRLPILDTTDPSKLDWVNSHLGLSFSDRERAFREKHIQAGTEHEDTIVNIKTGLHTILVGASGTEGKYRVFGLRGPIGGIELLIFVTELRLDLGSHTVVADAWILPLTEDLVPKISSILYRLHTDGIAGIRTEENHLKAWRRLIPAFTERCRQWEHKDDCEYISKGTIPLSLEYATIPICGCGKGIGTSPFAKVEAWKDVAGLVTRAAIGPLFAVSYLENMGLEMRKRMDAS